MKKTNQKGFTIVELVIVIAVVAILAAVLIPTFSSLVKKANLSADQVAVRNMNTALSIAAADGALKGPGDARKALMEAGFNADNLVPTTKDQSFYWFKTDNVVLLVGSNGVVVYPNEYKNMNTTDFAVGTLYPLGALPYAEVGVIEETVNLTPANVITQGCTAPESLDLDTALNFTAVHTPEEAAELPYAEWLVDYVITIDRDLNEPDTEYYLAGQYTSFSESWVLFGATGATAGSYQLLGTMGMEFTYVDICEYVSTFNCGVAVDGNANGLNITVELVMYETTQDWQNNENGHVINTYKYSFD